MARRAGRRGAERAIAHLHSTAFRCGSPRKRTPIDATGTSRTHHHSRMDNDPATDAFVAIATEYCAWLEAEPSNAADEHRTATLLVAALYAAAVRLQAPDPDRLPASVEAPDIDAAAIEAVRARLRSFPFQYYWEVFDALTETPDEPCLADVTDDLADIYCDVKAGLLALQHAGRPQAVRHWRLMFGAHWGRHAAGALRALHEFGAQRG